MSVRDRTQQIGVMRTLGYTRGSVLSLVMTESALISIIGGAIGTAVAFGFFQLRDITVQTRTYNFAVSLNWLVVLTGLGIAVLVGFAGGFLPALRASRLKIVDALRSVD
jgi:ABC-type antimicrobial peptide transport system permease subunit